MVLFVDHSREEFPLGDDGAARAFAEGVVPADKVTLHEEMFVESRGLVHADIEDFVAEIERGYNIFEPVEYFGFLGGRTAAQEFVAGKISGQADPRGYYNIGHRPGAVKPLIYIIAYICQFHVRIAYRL